MKEMDFLQKGDSSREFDCHNSILSNFTHDGTSIRRHFAPGWSSPRKQCFDDVSQKELRRFSAAEGDIVDCTSIAQDALAVKHKYVRSGNCSVQISDEMVCVDQDLWNGTLLRGLLHHLNGFILIRGNR